MRFSSCFLVLILLGTVWGGTARADFYLVPTIVEPSRDIDSGMTEQWDLDLDDYPGLEPEDTINSATLRVEIEDIYPFPNFDTENMTISVDGTVVANDIPSTPYGVGEQTHEFDVLLDVVPDHAAQVLISHAGGDGPFSVTSVSIVGDFTPAPVSAPSLPVIGLFILAFALFSTGTHALLTGN